MADVVPLFPSQPEGFLFVSQPNTVDLLPAELDPMPVRRPVRGLGQTTLKAVRTSRAGRLDNPIRHHRLYGVNINDYQHAVEITDPAEGEPQYAIMSLPGLTEHIECGIRQAFHASLAEKFPAGRIISVGSDGIGPNSDTYNWQERHQYDLEGMARHRVELALALAARLPLFVQGTSMGTTVSHQMNRQILADDELRSLIDPRGQLYVSPALVDPHNIVRDMGLRFVPGLAWDLGKELGLKSSRSEIAEALALAKSYGLSRRDGKALVNQMWELMHGTPEKEIGEVIAEIPTVVVAGEKDSLAQWQMWHRIQGQYPDNLELHSIRGRGHVMALKPGRICDKLSRTAQAKILSSTLAS